MQRKRDVKASQKQCMKDQVVSELEKILALYKTKGDKGRVMGYSRAISKVKAYSKSLTNSE